jgi:hypothetical protein
VRIVRLVRTFFQPFSCYGEVKIRVKEQDLFPQRHS